MANLKDLIVNGTSRFIGKVFGPTPTEGDYSKQLATTEYVIDNSANQSISNLNEDGESKINASKCLLTNTIVTNTAAYNTVKNYSQDSFDLSKFTVVGSPSISDEGIYVNQASANYLQIPVPSNTENFVLEFELYQERIPWSSANYALGGGAGSTQFGFINININNTGGTDVRLYQSDDTTITTSGIMTTALGLYKFNFTYQDKKLTETITKPDGTSASFSITGEIGGISQTSPYFRIGYYTGGSIDLKTLKFYSNGELYFTGANTEIDTIKPLDVEKLGDIHVNEHGIAENFNANNAIKAPISFNPTSTVKIRSLLTWNTGSTQPKDEINVPYVFGPSRWRIDVTSTSVYATNDLDTSTNTRFNIAIPELQNGDAVEIIETITIRTRTVKVIINETDEYSGSTTFAANQAFSTSELTIGNASFDGSSEYFWNGAINLNMFIVYIDGKLTYEPCLYIPYIQSKTGSKIVEKVYRNRVYELYDQTGKAEYYTLDTENENVTLPLGEIYGLIASKADTLNVANKSLEDLTEDGNALINNSKAWIAGKPTNDKTTYDSIEKLSISTFNKDNFTVYGSPNITENGIVTNLSTANRLNSTYYGLDDEFIVQTPAYTITNIATTQYIIRYSDGNFRLLISNTGKITLYAYTATDQYQITNSTNTLQVGTTYIFKVKRIFDGTNYTYTVYYKELGEEYKIAFTSVVQAIYSADNDAPIQIGGFDALNPFLGSIDLKYYYLINSGALIVCGNKTDIDVIKEEIEQVGDIEISDVGIAYNFSSANYVKSPNTITFGPDDELRITFQYQMPERDETSPNYSVDIIDYATTNRIFYNPTLNNFILYSYDNTNVGSVVISNVDFWGQLIYVDATITKSLRTLKISLDGKTWNTYTNSTSLNITENTTNIVIGHYNDVTTLPQYLTYFDLNTLHIYLNGNLVYQPCLKIPYTKSSSGAKIADGFYYSRVEDLYEQYGSTYYYTLDRQNGLSSLPFGDIYGLMMKKDNSPDYFSTDTPTEFPFIAWREGYVNVTVPANGKLLINDNEVVSAGTSAVQMQLRVGLYDNITFSNTTGATLTFYPCKGVLYTV